MASVNFEKMTTVRVGHMAQHMDNEERVEHGHKNKNIDTSLTHKNYCIDCDSYKHAIEKNKERVAEVDAVKPPKRKKADRITGVGLECPCPQLIADQGREDEFFQKWYNFTKQYFGAENVHGAVVHKDEVHEYIDARTKENKTSLMHAHALVTPYTEEKGINGKAFETRKMLNDYNKKLDKMIYQEFGVEFNNGKHQDSVKVEQLKGESEILRQENIQARQRAEKHSHAFTEAKIDEYNRKLEEMSDEKPKRRFGQSKSSYEEEKANWEKEYAETEKQRDYWIERQQKDFTKSYFKDEEVSQLKSDLKTAKEENLRLGQSARTHKMDGWREGMKEGMAIREQELPLFKKNMAKAMVARGISQQLASTLIQQATQATTEQVKQLAEQSFERTQDHDIEI